MVTRSVVRVLPFIPRLVKMYWNPSLAAAFAYPAQHKTVETKMKLWRTTSDPGIASTSNASGSSANYLPYTGGRSVPAAEVDEVNQRGD